MDRPVDEHVSISTVFLSHGARQVLAGLWQIGMSDVDELFAEIRDETDWVQALRNWQKTHVTRWRISGKNGSDSGKKNRIFYNLAPFRVSGFSLHTPDRGDAE
jgi:hypothetical protein